MAAAKCVLQDWNSGKIPYYTLPPVKTEQKVHLGAAVVASWSKEFEWTAEEDAAALQTIQSKADLKMPFLTMVRLIIKLLI
jgi:nuclear GTP-binding protein